jgi:hypothetical protein
MNTGGWIMLLVSWSVIVWLTAWTVWRTMQVKPKALSAPLDLEARIEEIESQKEAEEEAGQSPGGGR